jgi:hypothetical protein
MSSIGDEAQFLENYPEVKEVVYSETEIQTRVQQIADQINKDYARKSLVVVGILKGFYSTRLSLVCLFVEWVSLCVVRVLLLTGVVFLLLLCASSVSLFSFPSLCAIFQVRSCTWQTW